LLRFNRADHQYIDVTSVLEVKEVEDGMVGKAEIKWVKPLCWG